MHLAAVQLGQRRPERCFCRSLSGTAEVTTATERFRRSAASLERASSPPSRLRPRGWLTRRVTSRSVAGLALPPSSVCSSRPFASAPAPCGWPAPPAAPATRRRYGRTGTARPRSRPASRPARRRRSRRSPPAPRSRPPGRARRDQRERTMPETRSTVSPPTLPPQHRPDQFGLALAACAGSVRTRRSATSRSSSAVTAASSSASSVASTGCRRSARQALPGGGTCVTARAAHRAASAFSSRSSRKRSTMRLWRA